MNNDNRFYKVCKFYKNQNSIIFSGLEFKIQSEFSVNLKFNNVSPSNEIKISQIRYDDLKLDFIYNVKLTTNKKEFNVNNIKEKVIFCPSFDKNSSKFRSSKKGLIFRNFLEFHN